ncbi:MAG: chloride channel protein [Gemmatimonadaceae bacterium]
MTHSADAARDRRGDFTTRPRVLLIALLAAVVGILSAGIAAGLLRLISLITNLAYFHQFGTGESAPGTNTLGLWAVVVPIIGGVIIGLMARYGSEKIRGHGIPEAMEAILIGESRLSAKVAVLKPISSAIAIGTGGPFGAEGPIIMTGAAMGSVFSQAFHVSASERKTLLVAGAAAGMAAVFAAPLAAVLLAVELLLFEWNPRSFIPVAVAASVGAACRVPLLGAGPVFPIAPHQALSMTALLGALGVGLVAGLAAWGLTRLVYACEDAFAHLPLHWMWWPAIGGVSVGLGGLLAPRALGVGYDVLRDLLNGHLVAGSAVALLAAKAIMWAIALGSGTSGGVLAPLLMMGGALGAVEASAFAGSDSGLWALLSMAAVMGGTMRSPLTAVVFLLELTHDTNLLSALLVACVAAHAVTVLVMRRSILTEKVARRGHHVHREYAVNPLARFHVRDVMRPISQALPADMAIDGLFRRLIHLDGDLGREHAWPLLASDGSLVGMLTRGDALRALNHDSELTALEAGSSSLVRAYPDELLDEAMHAMIAAGVKQLPVVDRSDPERLLGMVDGIAISAIWAELHAEDHHRDSGPPIAMLRLLRRRMRRRLRDRRLPRSRQGQRPTDGVE